MANQITVEFTDCEPPPQNGYVITYRPVGGNAYRTAPGNFFASPAIWVDNNGDPEGTQYEGFIRSDCGGGKLGDLSPWSTSEVEESSEPVSVSVPEPEINFILQAAANFNITSVT